MYTALTCNLSFLISVLERRRIVYASRTKMLISYYTNLFVCTVAQRPSKQFFSHVGMEPTLPRFKQYCRELMCLAQGHNTVPPVGIEPRISRFGV